MLPELGKSGHRVAKAAVELMLESVNYSALIP